MTDTGVPKPQYYALENFNQLLKDPDPNFTPGNLTYSLDTGGASVNSVLLEKSNGTFLLFLWTDADVWNYTSRTNISLTPTDVQLSFPTVMRSVVENNPSVSAAPTEELTNVNNISVPVGGGPVVISVQP